MTPIVSAKSLYMENICPINMNIGLTKKYQTPAKAAKVVKHTYRGENTGGVTPPTEKIAQFAGQSHLFEGQ